MRSAGTSRTLSTQFDPVPSPTSWRLALTGAIPFDILNTGATPVNITQIVFRVDQSLANGAVARVAIRSRPGAAPIATDRLPNATTGPDWTAVAPSQTVTLAPGASAATFRTSIVLAAQTYLSIYVYATAGVLARYDNNALPLSDVLQPGAQAATDGTLRAFTGYGWTTAPPFTGSAFSGTPNVVAVDPKTGRATGRLPIVQVMYRPCAASSG